MDEMGLVEARNSLGELVERARVAWQPTLVMRHGKRAAVIMPADSLDAITSALRLAVSGTASENHAQAYRRALNALTGEKD